MRTADLFAGWGGFSLGAEQAGAEVIIAANHWRLAVDAHQSNHPGATHLCQDLNQANFYDWPDFDLLLAGPSCQGYSQAAQPSRKRDGTVKRHHDALRSTAWAVISAADAKEPGAIIVENVPDFLRWRLYRAWNTALEDLGYSLEQHVIRASHLGVPQRRDRLFIVAVRAGSPLGLTVPKTPEPAFGPHIEWDTGNWKPVAGKSIRVRERIAAGRARGLGDRFLTQHVTGHRGVSLDEPIRTITTKRQWAVVDGERMRPLTVRENARAMGFPDDYRWPSGATNSDQIRGLGNSVCPPVAKWLVEQVRAAA